jgi:hypothetical protein
MDPIEHYGEKMNRIDWPHLEALWIRGEYY